MSQQFLIILDWRWDKETKKKRKWSITCAVHVISQKVNLHSFASLSPHDRLYSTHSLLGLGLGWAYAQSQSNRVFSTNLYNTYAYIHITIIGSVFSSLLSYPNQPTTENEKHDVHNNWIQLLTPIIWLTLFPGNAVSASCIDILHYTTLHSYII